MTDQGPAWETAAGISSSSVSSTEELDVPHRTELERSGISLVGKINSGGFGQVFKVELRGELLEEFPEHEEAAMKVAPLDEENPWYRDTGSRREIIVIKNVQHKNIIKMIKLFDFPDFLIIVMELAKGSLIGEIVDVEDKSVARQVENKFRPWLKGACEGLQFLHRSGYIHRDLKPGNILITMNNVAVLCDFGLSRPDQDDRLSSTFVGTSGYSAPQIVRKVGYKPKSADCWSMGVTIYECLTGDILIDTEKPVEKEFLRRTKKVKESLMSSEAKELVYYLLCMEEVDRWSVDKALKSSFFMMATESGSRSPGLESPGSSRKRKRVSDPLTPRGRPPGAPGQ